MRFRLTSKADKKIIKKALHNKSYTYGLLGMKDLPFKTDIKTDIKFLFNDIFPKKPAAYTAVASAIIVAGVLFYICGLKANIIDLNNKNQMLIVQNSQLCTNLEDINCSVIELDTETKIQLEVIQNQEKEINDIELSVENMSSEKDKALNELINMINDLDIFNSLVSRSGNFYSASTQIQEAKAVIVETLGDSEESNELIDKLNIENEKIENYRKRYPDFQPVTGRLSSNFGYRRDPFTGVTTFHYGIDISAGYGTTIYSAAYGTVIFTGYDSSSGNHITIDHGNGYKTEYKHLSSILTKKGDVVNKGQRIGLVGSTGRSTGPHLHFEVRVNGSTTNPLEFVYYN